MTEENSTLTYAGIGGLTGCCLLIELLGGAAILSGISTAIGLSNSIIYLAAIGITGLTTTALIYLYQKRGELI
jgi:hypothetical protein